MDSKIRLRGLDSLAGLLIVYMIVFHCLQNAGLHDSFLYVWTRRFLYFFMAWFYFKAGMFHKIKAEKEILKNSVRRFIRPYVAFTLLAHLFCCLNYAAKGDFNIIHYTLSPFKQIVLFEAISWNLPLWFLISLFVVKNIFNIWSLLFNPEILLVFGIIASLTSNNSQINPIFIQNIALGLFFYACGYCLGKIKLNRLFYAIFYIVYVWAILHPSYVDFRANIIDAKTSYFQWIVVTIVGILLYNWLFLTTPPILQKNIFSMIGRESMFFYCVHWIIIMIVKNCIEFSNWNFSDVQLFFFLIISEVLLLFFLFKVIPLSVKNMLGV